MKAKTRLRQKLNSYIKTRPASGLSSPSIPTDGSTAHTMNQHRTSLNANTMIYRDCNELPLTVFERYVLYGELQGIAPEHWEQLYSEYNELTGDTSVASLVMNIGKHTALVLKLTRITTLLESIQTCYDNDVETEVDIEPIIVEARKEFKQLPLQFSKESYKKDLQLCNNFLKDTVRQIDELEKILHKEKGEGGNSKTFFDDVLMAYSKVNKSPLMVKSQISTQTFALAIKDLQQHGGRSD